MIFYRPTVASDTASWILSTVLISQNSICILLIYVGTLFVTTEGGDHGGKVVPEVMVTSIGMCRHSKSTLSERPKICASNIIGKLSYQSLSFISYRRFCLKHFLVTDTDCASRCRIQTITYL